VLSLEDPRWAELEDAYGTAADIPERLRQLATFPTSNGTEEPWYTLWSALAHQGDVYGASFAAVPHVVACLAQDPTRADPVYFQFPAWVEICRQKRDVQVPDDLLGPYRDALAQLPELVARASARAWDEDMLTCALAAVAVSQGYGTVAEAVMELETSVAERFMQWRLEADS
jgi:hypothetical protein